jgi:hypothetical protein
MAQAKDWNMPPASITLNDKIAEGIMFCEGTKSTEYHMVLDKHDLYVLDYCVPQTATSPKGEYIGMSILRKTFSARKELQEPNGDWKDSEMSKAETMELLKKWGDR